MRAAFSSPSPSAGRAGVGFSFHGRKRAEAPPDLASLGHPARRRGGKMRFNWEDIMATGLRLIAILGFVLAALPAHSDSARLAGGPQGVVKSTKGELLEGIMVQLIAGKNAVRTTVYSNADGHYEF